MQPATILDLADIAGLMSQYEGSDCHPYVRMTLLHPAHHWFVKDGTAMLYEIREHSRYDMHIYNTAKGGKDLRDWCIRTGDWIFENTDAETLTNYVLDTRKDLKMFMRMLGINRIAKVNTEVLYMCTREDRQRLTKGVV